MNKKQREIALTMDMGKPVAVTGYRVAQDGRVELMAGDQILTPVTSTLTRYYERGAQKTKTIYSVPLEEPLLSIHYGHSLRRLHLLYAVDTNTIQHPTKKGCLSVTVAMEYELTHTGEMTRAEGRNVSGWQTYFENRDSANELAEKWGWVALIRKIVHEKRPDHDLTLRIGIIVDHDLSNIPIYNSRQKPLIPSTQYFLPPRVELFYASADKPGDSVFNRMIADCDRRAKEQLERLVEEYKE